MKQSTRLAALAVAALITLGGTGAAAASHGHGHDNGTNHGGQHGTHHGYDHFGKDQRHVLRDIDHLDKRLVAVAKTRLARLTDPANTAAVVANVTADRAALATLAETVKAADSTSDLKQVRRDLKAVRVTNYNETVNDLRFAERLTARVSTLRTQVVEASPEAVALDEAETTLTTAVAAARLVTAHTDKATLRAVKAALVVAKVQVEVVADALDASDEDPTDPEAMR